MWERIEFEDEIPPSVEALWRHWLRTCWVSHFWLQSVHSIRHNSLDGRSATTSYSLTGMLQRTLKMFVTVLASFCVVVTVKRVVKPTAVRVERVAESVDLDVHVVIVKIALQVMFLVKLTHFLKRRFLKTMLVDRERKWKVMKILRRVKEKKNPAQYWSQGPTLAFHIRERRTHLFISFFPSSINLHFFFVSLELENVSLPLGDIC